MLKVRIIADLEARVAAEMKRENLTQSQARSLLLKDDAERRKWTQSLYGADPWDASLYDLVIHINQLTVDDAVDFIVQAAGRAVLQDHDRGPAEDPGPSPGLPGEGLPGRRRVRGHWR